jgi:hypothetical protein
VKAGDLIAWGPPTGARIYGVVISEDKGYIKIRWNDGHITVLSGQTIANDSHHYVFSA